ncbi:uncharacterized protein LOC135198330 [Macrobrachium nipponense]|uniref:uncharacterized protein LOC135198330 n=1 Tax=Macrobrachium nipponense TaxID=159736 RepID=UPI0030C7CCCA
MSRDIDENSARAYSVTRRRQLNVIRIGQLYIGSMKGNGRELAELMRIKRVDILCVQESRWKSKKAKELWDGYKLIYSGANEQGRNVIGVVLSGEMKNAVAEVSRKNVCIMRVKICYGGETMNIISAYAPQVGCTEEEKNRFWNEMSEVTQELEEQERIVVGADFNGHFGNEKDVIERVHGGHGIGERNPEGKSLVDFAVSFDMLLATDSCVLIIDYKQWKPMGSHILGTHRCYSVVSQYGSCNPGLRDDKSDKFIVNTGASRSFIPSSLNEQLNPTSHANLHVSTASGVPLTMYGRLEM